MLSVLGAEILSLIAKEVAKQSPAIATAVMKELEDISASLYKYMTAEEIKRCENCTCKCKGEDK
jgi:hypothetical protein